MSASQTRDFLVFAGQGSKQHFTEAGAPDSLRELLGLDQEVATTFSRFLDRARDALRDEYSSAQEGWGLGQVDDAFERSDNLLSPPPRLQSHPVFETISLYTRQVFELMVYQSQRKTQHVAETTGVCTGLLAAILAASFSSYASDDFVSAAIDGARLAFWIGVRAASLHLGWKEDSPTDTRSCVLSVFGVPDERMGELLKSYAEESDESCVDVQISAVFSDNVLSLSSHGTALQKVETYLKARQVECRWAHVHALYHRGPQSENAVREVLKDVERRNISFPDWRSLHAPILSAAGGRHMGPIPATPLASTGLLEQALRNMFIDKVDWRRTSANLRDHVTERLRGDSLAAYRIIGLGPGSRSLLKSLGGDSLPTGLRVVDSFAESLAPAPDDIAVIGLSVNIPGGKGQDQFWQLLSGAMTTVTEIPPTRFRMPDVDEGKGKAQRAKHGNFLTDPFEFDPAYFNLSPREAKSMDPQQRLVLIAALEALEDAGYAPDSTPTFQRERVGVYMGVATGDYVDNLRDDIDVYYSPGTLRAFIAGRISYAFKLGGPSMVIDTACSSSLVSIYHACTALRSGECGTALAGGVNTMTSPDMYSGLARAHFLSPTGQCKPFDETADGYCRAEGCGVVVLKRLCDAVAEGDRIYGVIRGIAVNQCGTAKSITHPHSETQAALMKTALASARTIPRSISVLEAHGTGTQAGDAAEMASVKAVFCPRTPEETLYVSSLKGNIGHLEAASGVASLIKLLLMMEKGQIPAQASFRKLNPRLPATGPGQVTIPTRMTEWRRRAGQATPRRALLNNFGASGSNAALVLEEFEPPRPRARIAQQQSEQDEEKAGSKRSHHILNISAKTAKALEAARRDMASYLAQHPNVSLDDLCYTANARRQEYLEHRSSIVVSDRNDALEKLGEPVKDSGQPRPDKPHKIVFAFSGQGGVYPGMGAALLSTVPLFRSIVDQCDEILAKHGFPTVRGFLANSSQTPSSSPDNAEYHIVVSQCACFVLEYALAMTWSDWGVTPDLVVGHSIGEYASFAFAGMMSMEDALLLLAWRARLMVSKCAPNATGMMACRLPRTSLEQLLADHPHDLTDITISCFNSPGDMVLAGPLTSLDKLSQHCKNEGARQKRLDVPYGFHSPAMEPILEDLDQCAGFVRFHRPSLRVGSSLLGRLFKESETVDGGYFSRHAREPVNFCGVVQDTLQELEGSHPTFIEIGPSPSTESMLKQIFSQQPYSFLCSLTPTRPAWESLSAALQGLYLRRYGIRWRQVYRGSPAKFITGLPGYPLNLLSYAVLYKPPPKHGIGSNKADQKASPPRYAFLTNVKAAQNGKTSTCQTSTAMGPIQSFIEAHQVGAVPLCPASVYLEIVSQTLAHHTATDIERSMFMFENVKFDHPLIGGNSPSTTAIQTTLTIQPGEGHSYACSSKSGNSLCAGDVRSLERSSQTAIDLLARRQGRVARLMRSFDDTRGSVLVESFSERTIYQLIFPRVVQYNKPLMTLRQLTTAASGSEGYGVFDLPSPAEASPEGRFVTSPAFVDTLLHAPGFVANTLAGADTACICVAVEQALIPSDRPELHQQKQPLRVYYSLVDIEHSYIADAYALGTDGRVVGYVEGMCFRKVKLAAFKAHLSRLAQRSGGAAPDRGRNNNNSTVAGIPAANTNTLAPRGRQGSGPSAPVAPSSQPSEFTDMSATISTLVRDLSGVDFQPTGTTTLAELGLDSLLCVELSATLAKTLRCEVSPDALQACGSVADILELLVVGKGRASSAATSDWSAGRPTPPSSSPAGSSSPRGRAEVGYSPVGEADHEEPQVLALGGGGGGGGGGSAALEDLVRSVCGVVPDDHATPLAALGVDSLLSIELCQALRDDLGVTVDDHSVVGDLTYGQLEEMCAAQLAAAAAPRPPVMADGKSQQQNRDNNDQQEGRMMVRQLQKRSDGGGGRHNASGLYLFHDGSGSCAMYARVGQLGRDVYGVPSLKSGAQTLEGLAADYIRRANLAGQDGLILGGWSFGGVLAFEISRQLATLHGRTVKGLILIDSPAPVNHQALPGKVVQHVLSRRMLGSAAAREMLEAVAANFGRYAALLETYSRGDAATAAPSSVPCVLIRCRRTMDLAALCDVNNYPWLSDIAAADESIRTWERLLGRPLPVLNLDCDHFSPFEPENIAELSRNLRQACEMLEA
ncbi:hypothetical protein C7999DRAFT_35640 [Corynascus novoguineensis]|uniref:Polyketide synthase n=1 Tax=Corynascus novoguineensis TaxID=1126955 RepID=A0AAN7CL12_9PEZI|nr:hypothetical protein C7999DRAFT_35640 [Corynascus novoguineensis]